MDLQYMFLLQQLRAMLGGCLDEIFNGLSKVAVVVMPLLPVAIYWCVSKKWGYRFLATIWCGEVVNGLVKLTVCAYRPWIRAAGLEPAGDSKVAATGYSFPSGHTMCATATYGTLAVWQYKKRRWIAVTCGILIMLTMFSRNFLGVHTPQDVLIGFLETAVIIVAAGFVMRKLEGNERLADILSIAGIVFVAASIVYILVKPYPMDYVNGELLVDPQKMMKDCFNGCGGLLGLIIGSFLERRFINYEIPKQSHLLPIVTAAGLGLVFAWNEYFADATVVLLFGRNWGNFAAGLLAVLFVTAVYPLVIRRFCPADVQVNAEAN